MMRTRNLFRVLVITVVSVAAMSGAMGARADEPSSSATPFTRSGKNKTVRDRAEARRKEREERRAQRRSRLKGQKPGSPAS